MRETRAAPDGWMFVKQYRTWGGMTEEVPPTDANWPAEQVHKCAAMPTCVAVSFGYTNLDIRLIPNYLRLENMEEVSGGNPLEAAASSTMPQQCMGTMMRTGEWVDGRLEWVEVVGGGWRPPPAAPCPSSVWAR